MFFFVLELKQSCQRYSKKSKGYFCVTPKGKSNALLKKIVTLFSHDKTFLVTVWK